MDWPSLSTRLRFDDSESHSPQRQRPRRSVSDRPDYANFSRPPGICVPRELSDSEFQDIQRCFERANARVEGYLDCTELKVYMDLRKCPITQWEAEKLLEYADPTYQYYITLQQVTNLAINFGIGTQHPLRLTRSEFEIAIERSFRPSSTTTDEDEDEMQINQLHRTSRQQSRQEFDFDGVVNYFESKVMDETEDNNNDFEQSIPPTSRNIGIQNELNFNPTSYKTATVDTREMGIQTDNYYSPMQIINSTFPKKITVDPEQDEQEEAYIDDEPLEPVRRIKERWEHKIRELIENNGDDFLVKLDNERKLAISKLANNPHNNGVYSKSHRQRNAGKTSKFHPVMKTTRMQPQPPPPIIKSIFKRENVQNNKVLNTDAVNRTRGDEDRQSQTQGVQTRQTISKGQDTSVGNNDGKFQKKLPDLPPPIVPELPIELRPWKVNHAKPTQQQQRKYR